MGLAEAREERVRGNMSFADSPLNELNGELIDQRPGRWAEIVEKIRAFVKAVEAFESGSSPST